MGSYIPDNMRRQVAERADFLCEYCLIHEDDTFAGCHVDHVISIKHGGLTELSNLAFACAFCNRNKGSDIGSIYWNTGEFVRFFNPRVDRWSEHFQLKDIFIAPKTSVGEVTARILRINDPDRLFERRELSLMMRYPTEIAHHHIHRLS